VDCNCWEDLTKRLYGFSTRWSATIVACDCWEDLTKASSSRVLSLVRMLVLKRLRVRLVRGGRGECCGLLFVFLRASFRATSKSAKAL
jgi:hypothetical protein